MDNVKIVQVRVGDSLAEAEKALLIATLNHHNGDKVAAARDLGVTRNTIYNLMRRYGLFSRTRVERN